MAQMQISSEVKKFVSKKRKYASLLSEVEEAALQLPGTQFVVEMNTDPESSELNIVVRAVKSDLDWKELDEKMSVLMRNIYRKSLHNGPRIIPLIDLADAKTRKKK